MQTLIYHQQTKALLYEVSHGDANNVNDAAVAEVLARYEAELRRPIRATAWRAILGVGAATALWFAIFSAIPNAKATLHNPPTVSTKKAATIRRHS